MSYVKQNFQNGLILTAEHMKALEIGILNSELNAQESIIKIATIAAGETEITIPFNLTQGSGPYAAIIPSSELAKELFANATITSSIGNYNYKTGLETTIKGKFDSPDYLPWRDSLHVAKFEYAKGEIKIILSTPSETDLSYICIFAKENSAEQFLGDFILDTIIPLQNEVEELKIKVAAIEEALI